jgi:hypothetical protein
MKTCTSCGRKNGDEAANCHECGNSNFILPGLPVDPLHRVGPAFEKFLNSLVESEQQEVRPASIKESEDSQAA